MGATVWLASGVTDACGEVAFADIIHVELPDKLEVDGPIVELTVSDGGTIGAGVTVSDALAADKALDSAEEAAGGCPVARPLFRKELSTQSDTSSGDRVKQRKPVHRDVRSPDKSG